MEADAVEKMTVEVFESLDLAKSRRLAEALAAWNHGGTARELAVSGSGWLVCFKLSHDPTQLHLAVDALDEAHRLHPTPSRAMNLGGALIEWAGLPEQDDPDVIADAHRRGLQHLRWAVNRSDDPDAWIHRATALLRALVAALDRRMPGAEFDEALELGERVVTVSSQMPLSDGEAENLYSGALLLAAGRGDPRGDVDRAVELSRVALTRLADTHPDRPARLAGLGAALTDRYEGHGSAEDRVEAIGCLRQAVQDAAPGHIDLPLMVNNLVNALVADVDATGSRAHLEEALRHVELLRSAFPVGHPLRPVALSNAGLALRLAATVRGSASALADAISCHREAVELTPRADAAWPGRAASYAVVLGDRFHLQGDPADLDDAIGLGRDAIAHPHSVPHEVHGFLSNLGSLYHSRFLRTGHIQDLQTAAHHHRQGLARIAEGHPDTPALLNNAGTVLSDLFDRFGDPEDLADAISALGRALDATPAAGRLYPGRQVNLAVALQRRFSLSGDPEDLTVARRLTRDAHRTAVARHNGEVAGAAFGAHVDGLRAALTDLGDPTARDELGALAETDTDPDTHAPPLRAARSLRSYLTRQALGLEPSWSDLERIANLALTTRPAVALGAARQMVSEVLATTSPTTDAVDRTRRAILLGIQALGKVVGDDAVAIHELSWRRDARGLASMAAQVFLRARDPRSSLDAFASGHAVVLSRSLGVDRSSPSAAPGEMAVTAWATQWGGGLIVDDGDTQVGTELPRLTSDRVGRWVKRLGTAAGLGPAALEPVLTSVLADLGQQIGETLRSMVPEHVPMIWCGGGHMALLPIEAVTVDGTMLADRNPIRRAPTAPIGHGLWARQPRHPTGAADGPWVSVATPTPSRHPQLPGAAEESRCFADPGMAIVGDAAVPDRVRQALTEAALFHFAGHAMVSPTDPMASHLLLADDQPLFAEDIAGSRISADLVVLSACDTAQVGPLDVEEALSLASAFHVGGARGVIASLWPVQDRHTADLMAILADLLRAGNPPVAALTEARRRAAARGVPPGVWASFVLSGT